MLTVFSWLHSFATGCPKSSSKNNLPILLALLSIISVAYMDVEGQGREQAVSAHPALTAFVHPYTAGAEALQQELHKRCYAPLALAAP